MLPPTPAVTAVWVEQKYATIPVLPVQITPAIGILVSSMMAQPVQVANTPVVPVVMLASPKQPVLGLVIREVFIPAGTAGTWLLMMLLPAVLFVRIIVLLVPIAPGMIPARVP